MPALLFVCLGNICRSPMAEAIFRHLLAAREDAASWHVESAGTGHWHVGEAADPRALAVLQGYGITSESRAQQVAARHFREMDFILAMDESNLDALARAPGATEFRGHLGLLGAFDPEGPGEVGDPFYGNPDGFEGVYHQVSRCCQGFLDHWDQHKTPKAD